MSNLIRVVKDSYTACIGFSACKGDNPKLKLAKARRLSPRTGGEIVVYLFTCQKAALGRKKRKSTPNYVQC